MKKKIKIRFIVTLQLLSLLFCISCDSCDVLDFGALISPYGGCGCGGSKDWVIIPPGLATNVSGKFYDDNRNSPIEGAKIFVEEYIDDPTYDLIFSRYIDSTVTDQNGNFELPFTTTGAGVQYKLSFKLVGDNWWWNNLYSSLEIVNIGGDNVINNYATKLSILEAKVNVINNPYPSLAAGSGYRNAYMFYKPNQDSIIFLPVMPNQENKIFFTVMVDTLPRYYYRERLDTVNMVGDFSDTIKAEFELHPGQFKKIPN